MGPDLTLWRVAFAVRHLESSRALFESLFGASFAPSENVVAGEVRCLEWVRGPGRPVFELVSPANPDNAVARFIRKRGEGIHHLSLRVPDLEAAVAHVEGGGGRVLRVPSYYRDGAGERLREVFLHPKDASGVLFHLSEAP